MQRRATPSPLRRYAWTALLASAVVALALGLGGVWPARVGIVVALLGAAFAVVLAWREVAATRRELLLAGRTDARAAADLLSAERSQHARVVGVLQARNSDLRTKLTTARAEQAALAQEASRLRGDKAALEAELARFDADASAARDAAEAEVFNWPRRVSGRETDDDFWGIEGAPTVVQLQALANPPRDLGADRRHA